MEDTMIDRPNMVFDEKIGNKRVRDGEEELNIGRLEKRPSGIIGLEGFEDYSKDVTDEGEKHGNGIIDTFISNVFHKSENGHDGEKEVEAQVQNDVFNGEVEEKQDDSSVVCGSEGGEGGGIINAFFSNIFHNNESKESENNDNDQAKSEVLDLNTGKLEENNDTIPDLPTKPLEGNKLKPEDYSERVFFLNNN